MKVANIQGIKKVFLENKEITQIKDFSYSPLSKESFDKTLAILGSVSSTLFIANAMININKQNKLSSEKNIPEDKLKKLQSKYPKHSIQDIEKHAALAINSKGEINEDLLSKVFSLKARWDAAHSDSWNYSPYQFKHLLPFITVDGKYSEEVINSIEGMNPYFVMKSLEHCEEKYGKFVPELIKIFDITENQKVLERHLKQIDLLSEDNFNYIKNFLSVQENLSDFIQIQYLKRFVTAKKAEDYKFLNDLLYEDGLSEGVVQRLPKKNKEAIKLYYSTYPKDYLYHMCRNPYRITPIPEKDPKIIERIESLKSRLLKNPKILNSNLTPDELKNYKTDFANWFTRYYLLLSDSIEYLDNTTLDYLLYRYFEENDEILTEFLNFTKKEKELYLKLTNNSTKDEKLTSKNKVGIINIINLYKTYNIPMDKLKALILIKAKLIFVNKSLYKMGLTHNI